MHGTVLFGIIPWRPAMRAHFTFSLYRDLPPNYRRPCYHQFPGFLSRKLIAPSCQLGLWGIADD